MPLDRLKQKLGWVLDVKEKLLKIAAAILGFAGLAHAATDPISDNLTEMLSQFFVLMTNIATGIAGVGSLMGSMIGYAFVAMIALVIIGTLFGILAKFGVRLRWKI